MFKPIDESSHDTPSAEQIEELYAKIVDDNYNPALLLLARWVQAQIFDLEVKGEKKTPLYRDTWTLLQDQGLIDSDGVWALHKVEET